jgi:phage shock protein A
MSQANIDPSADLETIIAEFNSLVQKPNDSAPTGTTDDQNLWYSWQFLQIYSTWGLRLPHTEATLKMKLGIANPGTYLFFQGMVQAYDEIHQACYDFTSNIFPEVIDVGKSLLDFASDANQDDGELFNVLTELINGNEDDIKGALELLSDLQDTTKKNTKKAEEVIKLLDGYKAKLVSAQEKVTNVKSLVDRDSQVSQSAINAMQGGSEVTGSIQNLEKLLNGQKAEYDHAVVVAATTPTYAWATLIGFITAAAIAGVYGDKAVRALRRIQELEDEIKKTNAKLSTALETNKVSNSANQSISQAQRYTDLAIVHTTTVQNAWTDMTGNLGVIADKVRMMTTEEDEQIVLRNKKLVLNYAKKAGEKWALIVPPLKELTRNPYIVVEPNEKSLGEIANDVEKEITKRAA